MAGRFVRIRIIADFKGLQDCDDALHRHVIADLIRNPEGQGVTWGNNKTTPTIFPLSLDGRVIKGEGETRQHQPSTPSTPTYASACYAYPASQSPA